MAKPLTPQQVRDAELPRALRGFDEDATRSFLSDAASTLHAVTKERDELRKQVDRLNHQVSQTPTDAETIGAVLLTAHRAGEEMLAKAAEDVAGIHEDAERQRVELLVRARAEAEAMLADADSTITTLRHQDEDLRRSIAMYRQELVVFLRTALTQLDEVETLAPQAITDSPAEASRELHNELLAQLPSE